MAAPKDPKEKPKITLDLDIKPPPERAPQNIETPKEATNPHFKSLNVTLMRHDKPGSPPPANTRPPVMRSNRRPKTKTKTKLPKAKPNRIKPVFIFAGVLITGLLLSRYMDSFQAEAPQAPRASAPKMAAKSPKTVQTDRIPTPAKPEAPISDPYADIRNANLSQLGVEVDAKGNTYFAVRVKPKPVCHPADVEAMRNVVGKTGSLLLSLEPMAEDGGKVISRSISLKEIIEGTKVSLPVNLKKTGVYGIYICGDAANARSCGGKKPADFNKILNFRELDVAANAVFYYQFAVIGLDYATVYTGLPNKGMNDARNEIQERKPSKDWKPQLEKAANMMRGVKSLPPKTTVEGNVVTLELQVAMVNPDGSCR